MGSSPRRRRRAWRAGRTVARGGDRAFPEDVWQQLNRSPAGYFTGEMWLRPSGKPHPRGRQPRDADVLARYSADTKPALASFAAAPVSVVQALAPPDQRLILHQHHLVEPDHFLELERTPSNMAMAVALSAPRRLGKGEHGRFTHLVGTATVALNVTAGKRRAQASSACRLKISR